VDTYVSEKHNVSFFNSEEKLSIFRVNTEDSTFLRNADSYLQDSYLNGVKTERTAPPSAP
jgi:hypothetical protein